MFVRSTSLNPLGLFDFILALGFAVNGGASSNGTSTPTEHKPHSLEQWDADGRRLRRSYPINRFDRRAINSVLTPTLSLAH